MTVTLTDEQIRFIRTSLDYSAMRFRDYDYGPDLAEFGKQQRAREQAMIESIRNALGDAKPAGPPANRDHRRAEDRATAQPE